TTPGSRAGTGTPPPASSVTCPRLGWPSGSPRPITASVTPWPSPSRTSRSRSRSLRTIGLSLRPIASPVTETSSTPATRRPGPRATSSSARTVTREQATEREVDGAPLREGDGMSLNRPARSRRWLSIVLAFAAVGALTILLLALLTNIFERKQEARQPFVRVVEVTEETADPKPWGQNWPFEYDSYLKTSLPTTTV